MKNKKIMILAPILFVVCAIGILLIRESYSAPDNIMTVANTVKKQKYYYIRRNMLSHHYITNNSDPSGTIILKTGSVSSVSGRQAIVYCAHKGKTIAKSSEGKYYQNVPIEKTSVKQLKNAKSKLIGVMTNSYPYISISELKSRIKAGIGESEYNKYKFDTLDAQEAMTATQASIWNAIDGKINSKYRTTKSIGKIKYANFHKTKNNSTWALNWDSTGTYNIKSNCYNGTGSNLDCGSKSTFLADGDTAQNTGSYKKNNSTTLVGERINRLITWYFSLNENSASSSAEEMPSFGIQAGSDVWTDEGRTLTVTILSNNDKYTYSTESDYQISFTDLAGKALEISESTPITSGSLIKGYKYVIKNIDTKGVLATASATIKSDASNVYVYEANKAYANTQYLIGVEPGDIPVDVDLQILNEAKGKVYVYKTALADGETAPKVYTGKQDNICGASKPCQEGAEFVIYAQDKETVLKEFETDTTPTELNLPLGTYYIQEVAAPVGYTINETMQEFKIESEETVVSVHYNNFPTQICIKKVSTEDGETTIDGATLQLQSMVGGVYEDFTSSTQEDKGMHCTAPAQLPVGVYYIVETSAPANFVKTNVKYRIKVGNFTDDDISEEIEFDDGSTIKDLDLTTVDGVKYVAVIENKPGAVITKSDLATGGCVTGAHLVVKDSEGKQVDEWTSTCEAGNDNHEIDLEEGTYTLVEETTPAGYATSESIEFTVDDNGKVSTSLDMKDAPIEACFKKVSKNKEDGLVGAEFEIYDEDGELYNTFTSQTSETCFQYMPFGKYTIKETKAPDGYEKLETPIEVEVKNTGETQTFEIENEVLISKTDLDSSKIVIIIASIFMIFGLGLVGYYGYKKQV